MRRIIFITATIVFFSGHSFSQVLKNEEDSAIYEVKQMTKKWYEAIKQRDSITLEKILAPEYTVNGSWPRVKWMDNILHHFKMDSFEIAAEPRITYYGDAAISQGILFWKGSRDGKPFMNAEFSVGDIWLKKEDGHWVIHMRMLNFLRERK